MLEYDIPFGKLVGRFINDIKKKQITGVTFLV